MSDGGMRRALAANLSARETVAADVRNVDSNGVRVRRLPESGGSESLQLSECVHRPASTESDRRLSGPQEKKLSPCGGRAPPFTWRNAHLFPRQPAAELHSR